MAQPTNTWASDAFMYHLYPLGLCDAPLRNDFSRPAEDRLRQLYAWGDHIQQLGCNAIYMGPLFESTAHGYDTADYYLIDRRLGTNQGFQALSKHWHQRGLRLILDGVFHHVGRDFWAFRDVQQQGRQSTYRDWFCGIDFDRSSPYSDAFAYEGWNGYYDLVKLNLAHPDVRAHLFAAVAMWIEEFDIDGLRLDAADVMDLGFQRALAEFCRQKKADFWLMGEVIHGDYRTWLREGKLDATTNYECFKGLYSSHNDRNYFEITYSLNRQFGAEGIYQGLSLYNFVDNHDVNRIASTLINTAHLYTLHVLLLTMPGIPSIYYGSEWGIAGSRQGNDDRPLRPALHLPFRNPPHPDLVNVIGLLARIRQNLPALRYGEYTQLLIRHQQFAFMRTWQQNQVVIIVNAASEEIHLSVPLQVEGILSGQDWLNPGRFYLVEHGHLQVTVPACWGCIILLEPK
ncbi:alpha-amylase family glycosyl hydrolase [Spirosoma humi]